MENASILVMGNKILEQKKEEKYIWWSIKQFCELKKKRRDFNEKSFHGLHYVMWELLTTLCQHFECNEPLWISPLRKF